MPISSAIQQLLTDRQSLFLSTLDQQKQPFASYAPYAINFEKKTLYVLLSNLSLHSLHLLQNPQAAILITQDETDTQQIYARVRVQYQVQAASITTEPDKSHGLQLLREKHGDIIDLLKQLPDFHLFELTPIGGRYVEGFGKAYTIADASLYDGVTPITANNSKNI